MRRPGKFRNSFEKYSFHEIMRGENYKKDIDWFNGSGFTGKRLWTSCSDHPAIDIT